MDPVTCSAFRCAKLVRRRNCIIRERGGSIDQAIANFVEIICFEMRRTASLNEPINKHITKAKYTVRQVDICVLKYKRESFESDLKAFILHTG